MILGLTEPTSLPIQPGPESGLGLCIGPGLEVSLRKQTDHHHDFILK